MVRPAVRGLTARAEALSPETTLESDPEAKALAGKLAIGEGVTQVLLAVALILMMWQPGSLTSRAGRSRAGRSAGRQSSRIEACESVEGVDHRVGQRLPARLDDVLADADRGPTAIAVRTHRSSTRVTAWVPLIESRIRTLKSVSLTLGQHGEALAHGRPERSVEGVDRTVAFTGGDDPFAVDDQLDDGIGLDAVVVTQRVHLRAPSSRPDDARR